MAEIDPTVFTAVRSLVIGLFFFLLSRKVPGKGGTSLKNLALLGVVGGSLAFLMFFNGLALTTGGRAAFIHKTLPVWASLLALVFLKEKLTGKQAGAIGLALAGLSVMELDSISFAVQLGDFLVLGATFLWAAENLLAKRFMNLGETNWRVAFGRMFFGSLILFGVAGLQGKLGTLVALQPIQWIYIVVSTLMLAWYVLTWYWGLRYINLSKASGLLLIAPVVSLVLGVFMGEAVFPLQLIGSGLILGGCLVLSQTRSEAVVHEP